MVQKKEKKSRGSKPAEPPPDRSHDPIREYEMLVDQAILGIEIRTDEGVKK